MAGHQYPLCVYLHPAMHGLGTGLVGLAGVAVVGVMEVDDYVALAISNAGIAPT